jgi:hypothetical protein
MGPFKHEQDTSLGIWVTWQRKVHKNNTLRLERKLILDEIGFAWKDDGTARFKHNDKRWHQQHEKLLEYKRINGNCMVPYKYEQDRSLGRWVGKQRKCHKNDVMKQDRKDLLDELGFVWTVDCDDYFHSQWKEQYEKMVKFEQRHGNCLVPHNKDNASLGKWVCNQRVTYASNKMRPDRKELLDKLNFVWICDECGLRETLWNDQYERLVEFQQKSGHCMVPRMRNKEDASLGNWVSRQRTQHNNNKLRPHRKKLLDNLDFTWKADSLAARSSTTIM